MIKHLNRVSLNGLRAIEAVARLGSQKAAAEELGVTVGAVNQLVGRGEDSLGRKIFAKQGRYVALTSFGQLISARLTKGVAELEAAAELALKVDHSALNISVAPVFAARWLVWRLSKFNELYPSIRVRVDADIRLVDLSDSDIDACIRVGWGKWPNTNSDVLYHQEVFPVCSPQLAEKIKEKKDLLKLPVISEPHSMFSWEIWLEPNGLMQKDMKEGPVYSDASLCLDASIASQGVFLAWQTLAQDSINSGRLVAPFTERYRTGISYYFVTDKNRRVTGSLKLFYDWLKSELNMHIPL
jgi:LysR family transcriptional regulator, glycine cleavage system transcriptional activator